MSDVNVVLPDDLVKEIEAEIAAGRAKSVEAVVARAVRSHLSAAHELRRELDEIEQDYRQNGGVDWETTKARLSKRLSDGG